MSSYLAFGAGCAFQFTDKLCQLKPSSYQVTQMMASVCISVMVCCFLAGIKLTFFIISCMVLYFGFVMKTVLITHQSFNCHWAVLIQHQGLSWLLCHQGGWGGCRRSWEVMPPGQLPLSDQRGVPYCMTLCSTINRGGRLPGLLWLGDQSASGMQLHSMWLVDLFFLSLFPTVFF